MDRHSGVLAHVSSLPTIQGIGTIGEGARQFARGLAEAGQRYWQMLPVGPTGYQDSPYQSPSTHAGNPLLIDLDDLVADGWLRSSEVDPLVELPRDRVDFGALIPQKRRLRIVQPPIRPDVILRHPFAEIPAGAVGPWLTLHIKRGLGRLLVIVAQDKRARPKRSKLDGDVAAEISPSPQAGERIEIVHRFLGASGDRLENRKNDR